MLFTRLKASITDHVYYARLCCTFAFGLHSCLFVNYCCVLGDSIPDRILIIKTLYDWDSVVSLLFLGFPLHSYYVI